MMMQLQLVAICCFALVIRTSLSIEVQRSLNDLDEDARAMHQGERRVRELNAENLSDHEKRNLQDQKVKRPHLLLGRMDAGIDVSDLWNNNHDAGYDAFKRTVIDTQRRSALDDVKLWAREVAEKISREAEQHGTAGLWGKRVAKPTLSEKDLVLFLNALNNEERKANARRTIADTEIENRQQPEDLGLWGKRSTKSKRTSRHSDEENRGNHKKRQGQPGNIGLWKGKRGFHGNGESNKPNGDSNVGLWGREKGMWERKRSNRLATT